MEPSRLSQRCRPRWRLGCFRRHRVGERGSTGLRHAAGRQAVGPGRRAARGHGRPTVPGARGASAGAHPPAQLAPQRKGAPAAARSSISPSAGVLRSAAWHVECWPIARLCDGVTPRSAGVNSGLGALRFEGPVTPEGATLQINHTQLPWITKYGAATCTPRSLSLVVLIAGWN